MVREGIPFVLVPVLIAAGFGLIGWWPLSVVFATVAIFMLYFFRDPARIVPEGAGLIVSAADGRVTRIEKDHNGFVVSVFLSPLDVHINRSPIAGRIREINYTSGKKVPATRDSASLVNERNTLIIDGEGLTVHCTQIAGILARRIVCWPKAGDNLQRGQKFGLIKFSSRTDLLIPDTCEVLVAIGDRVIGGETVIAKVKEAKHQ